MFHVGEDIVITILQIMKYSRSDSPSTTQTFVLHLFHHALQLFIYPFCLVQHPFLFCFYIVLYLVFALQSRQCTL